MSFVWSPDDSRLLYILYTGDLVTAQEDSFALVPCYCMIQSDFYVHEYLRITLFFSDALGTLIRIGFMRERVVGNLVDLYLTYLKTTRQTTHGREPVIHQRRPTLVSYFNSCTVALRKHVHAMYRDFFSELCKK